MLFQLGYGQTPANQHGKKVEFGSASSTFAGASFNFISDYFLEKENVYSYLPLNKPYDVYTDFGWKQGMFFWVNLSQCVSFKTQFDVLFGVASCKNTFDQANSYCRFFGVEYKPQFILKIGRCNTDPVIKMAPNMSYYLNQRQTYLILGPKWAFRKSDAEFLRKNNERNYSVGATLGIGVDNLFPNLDVAPEIVLSIDYQTGNAHYKQKSSNRFYTSLSLAINFF